MQNKNVEVYQGPVRPTDNEEHFRKTGETYLVPSSYEPPHITNQQGEVYREEQSELFKQINYSGVKEYTIPLN